MSIILQPAISEKSIGLLEQNKFIFQVRPQANKHLIADEIEKLYKVKVLAVNIVKNCGEVRAIRGRKIKTSGWKKAIITLKKGDKIPGFEVKD